MKNKLKTTLIILAIIVSCLSVGVYAGYVMSAADVSYTKPDGTTVSVKAALDELHAKEIVNNTEKAIGDLVTVGGEQFYVLEWLSGSNVATLISKYNLNTAGTAQQSEANQMVYSCEFSSTNYWSSSFTDSPFNLNDFIGSTSADVLGKAKSYGTSKGAISSRLLSYEEANELKTKASSNTKIATMLWGKENASGWLYYWLGSAYDTLYVYSVHRNGNGGWLSYTVYNDDNECGVRPVITVFKSIIS